MTFVNVNGKQFASTINSARAAAKKLRREGFSNVTISKTSSLKNKPGHRLHNYTIYYYR